jgi:hypothetical protein
MLKMFGGLYEDQKEKLINLDFLHYSKHYDAFLINDIDIDKLKNHIPVCNDITNWNEETILIQSIGEGLRDYYDGSQFTILDHQYWLSELGMYDFIADVNNDPVYDEEVFSQLEKLEDWGKELNGLLIDNLLTYVKLMIDEDLEKIREM